ncbi:DUF2497 domain-containing protein [Candidatus Hydrogenosomobacter endosymbioticus]|nr:DUF2497 domain-containing protein [Candidatus Hydrogenosomobacter endosymbioticus]
MVKSEVHFLSLLLMEKHFFGRDHAGDESMEEILSSIKGMIYKGDGQDQFDESNVIDLNRPIDDSRELKDRHKVHGSKEPELNRAEEPSEAIMKAMDPLFKALSIRNERKQASMKNKSMEEFLADLAEPLIKDWIEHNLAGIIEKSVDAYIRQMMEKAIK